MVLGVAAVVAIAGCKDPNWNRKNSQKNDAKNVATNVEPTPVVNDSEVKAGSEEPTPIVATTVNTCKCPPGTVHELPCACGADDCKCVVKKAAPVKPTTAPEPEFTTYIVQRGDYLAKISKKYNITINSIKEANGLKSDKIMIGQKLKLPGKIDVGEQKVPEGAFKKAPAKPKYTSYTGATKEYIVKSGDTLGHIAYGNGINIRQLKELNGLESDALRIGQKLKIPATAVVKTPAKPALVADEKKEEAPVVKEEPKAEDTSVTDALTQTESVKVEESVQPVVDATVAPVVEDEVSDALTYTVQEGEDLADVSIRWGVSAAAVRELNNLGENDKLKAGQVLKLPADAQQN